MAEMKKFLDQDGVETLWTRVLEQDYSSNQTLMAVIEAVDEAKADKSTEYRIVESDEYALAISDAEGNIAVAVDNDGKVIIAELVAPNIEVNPGEGGSEKVEVDGWLNGKHCYVLGDSLSADTKKGGSWHQKFCSMTGAILDPDKNRNWFSVGGTATIGTHADSKACAHTRAKRLVEYYQEGNPVDIIFLQNVNDINNNLFSAGINNKGTNTDVPFFENQVVTYNDHVIETTTPSAGVIAYFKEHMSDILAEVTPMAGTVIEMLYTNGASNAKELVINSAPSADGNITLTFKHGANYRDEKFNIAVTAGMSIADVVAAILEWNYVDVGTYDDIEGENGDSVVFISPYSLTFDGGSTGVTATVSDTKAISRMPSAFKSLDTADFTNPDKWVNECAISYWSAQKGLIEYLQKNIPTAKIFYLILPYYKVNFGATTGLRPDGSFDMEAWVAAGRGSAKAETLYAEQPLVANYYGCGYLDVVHNCGISPVNIQSFYPSNDVHPTTAGYNAWGETVARLMASK